MADDLPEKTGGDGTAQQRIHALDACDFSRLLNITIAEARDGYARVLMPQEGKKNQDGVIHGGAIFALADHAFGAAANAGKEHRVAVSAHIQYLSPATDDLEAVAEYAGGSKKYAFYRVRVCGNGKLVALFDGISIKVSP